jgi:hypothetical protein
MIPDLDRVPTRRVIFKATQHVGVINVTDFDPEIHQPEDESETDVTIIAAEPASLVEPASPSATPSGKAPKRAKGARR